MCHEKASIMQYDLAVVGGGLAGASLAMALAIHGARVVIVEHQPMFRDRIRGEVTHPWGVAETIALGIYQPLVDSCGHETRWAAAPARDLVATTPWKVGCLNFYHPDMQQKLLDLAIRAGAELRRPAEVIGVETGARPALLVRSTSGTERVSARLVVGADGRNSRVRGWAGFQVRRDPDCSMIAGALYAGLKLPEDTFRSYRNPINQQHGVIIPIGHDRFRAYFVFHCGTRDPLSGSKDEAAFVAGCGTAGGSAEWFNGAERVGPLATFNAADHWVDHPYRDGVVLIGDAAASSDPSFGAGLSLTLRDVRVLRDCLIAEADWPRAATSYAREHDRYYSSLHRQHDWARELFFKAGPEAEAKRAIALPKLAEDRSRRPDVLALGPDAPSDEAARRRFFGLD
jgi:2-polyprenyl-6-methoxyphenol hydroxylase-like FAD-dependent oxidoreductase